jgi:hypothetical protein
MLYIFVKNRFMIDKKTASRLYAMNQMGMSTNGPKRPKKGKESSETVTCTRDGGHACGEERGEVRAGGSIKEGKTSSGSRGEKNKVLKPGTFGYKLHQRKLEKVRRNAPKSDRSKF